ncbi:hypothetical protein NOV72_01508 [Caballeronia novacaledonica]|uniref:Uncharacterized protein n=1 Tax=Caballeronia novacaledonica TaxID=1544861 RepID=A0A2U3I2D5_9BURK|nr:hypothetical protein NOV72_01508 [Caballeronia novacaledonica]
MEETVPIIHRRLMRRNRNFGKNPYSFHLWYLRVTFWISPVDDRARNGA